ncbi:hypothetical protein LCGC14_0359470 [marine sediment metagenome]|uniref:Methyltransferase FkbM domain-containing protein n=1 Tax=marine sediment metagenome TaxID=412755 RepID=A0A0F9TRG1_9ZZZZ|nr:FkbM family methyltransferase [Candidatus Aminicenantes bacterium]
MINFNYKFDWTSNDSWALPDGEEMGKVLFEKVDSMVGQGSILTKNKGVCIQAGGFFGLWPIRYAQDFEWVITFEPMEESYACLMENIRRCGADNIIAINAALGYEMGTVNMQHAVRNISWGNSHVLEQGNDLSFHTNEVTEDIMIMAIDEFPNQQKRIDHIALDVEAHELLALRGAEITINQWHPTIVIEERLLAHTKNLTEARDWLIEKGYELAGQIEVDLYFVWKGK